MIALFAEEKLDEPPAHRFVELPGFVTIVGEKP
jgi:hypothetical protein